ncbi:GNAT family N-acetyltransferase [Holospora curviuscula]|uniref:Acetyltransferase (GNAT) family protein n=1 Tax=Holospora curviuscula TaxID=1082868 RepID=A0A2S5R7Z5_9PROT|nr:GNAT family N-acetyltransferase [Holospora curviuscula]PPE03459.1 Acetyltransferase (GNAT) family protein [Holospora curviuscula]
MLNKSKIDLSLENNFFSKVRFLPKLCQKMKIIDFPNGISTVNSTFASDTFNIISAKNLQETIQVDQAQSIISSFNAQKLPLAWWVGPNSSNYKVDEVLLSLGLEHVETELGMAALASDIDSHITSMPDNFKIKEARSLQDFIDYGNVMASVFEPFDEEAIIFYETIGGCYKKDPDVDMFVGYINNNPAAICFCIKADGIGGVYDIVTNPDFQKRGVGTLMTKIAIEHLKRKKCHVIGMQASNDGIGIYKKMGFISFGKFKVYSNKHMVI